MLVSHAESLALRQPGCPPKAAGLEPSSARQTELLVLGGAGFWKTKEHETMHRTRIVTGAVNGGEGFKYSTAFSTQAWLQFYLPEWYARRCELDTHLQGLSTGCDEF